MKNKLNTYYIRYNVEAGSSKERWRLVENEVQYLVSDIIISGYVKTTSKWHKESLQHKGHIVCEGNCEIIDGVAYIKTKRESSAIIRHVLKTISYRILGTAVTFSAAYYFSSSVELSSILSVGELLIKPVLYFLHERAWYKSDFGVRRNKKDKKV